jgi:hypothetical protein
MLIFYLRPAVPSCVFPADFPVKALYAFLFLRVPATWPSYHIVFNVNILSTRIFGEESKFWSSSCSGISTGFKWYYKFYISNFNSIFNVYNVRRMPCLPTLHIVWDCDCMWHYSVSSQYSGRLN